MLTENILAAANMDWLDFDTVPLDEECTPVGAPDALQKMKAEVKRTKALLLQKLGEPPIGVLLRAHRNEHDFGPYLSLRVYFNPNLPDAIAYALACEAQFPETWDDNAPVDWRSFRPASDAAESANTGTPTE